LAERTWWATLARSVASAARSSATISSLPGFRPIARRALRFGLSSLAGLAKVSEDGGMDELDELRPASSRTSDRAGHRLDPVLERRQLLFERGYLFSKRTVLHPQLRVLTCKVPIARQRVVCHLHSSARLRPNREDPSSPNALVTRDFENFFSSAAPQPVEQTPHRPLLRLTRGEWLRPPAR
jgi:hypothetical protein